MISVLVPGLSENFETVSVEIVQCPDLTQPPFNLAAEGKVSFAKVLTQVHTASRLVAGKSVDDIHADIVFSTQYLAIRRLYGVCRHEIRIFMVKAKSFRPFSYSTPTARFVSFVYLFHPCRSFMFDVAARCAIDIVKTTNGDCITRCSVFSQFLRSTSKTNYIASFIFPLANRG